MIYRNVIKKNFYKFTPYFLAVIGAGISLISYIFSAYYGLEMTALIVTTIHIGAGFIVGKIIQRLYQGTYTDALTNLWNRRYFYKIISQKMDQQKIKKSCLYIALIDVDNFKQVNDNLGHLTGDELLVQLATVFRQSVRDTDIVVRWGGDEFAIILPDIPSEEAFLIAKRIKETVKNKFKPYLITISVGIMQITDEIDAKRVLEKLDKALYQAKQTRNLIMEIN
jgi:diguanylate cyclase (GGDEF)-like protein